MSVIVKIELKDEDCIRLKKLSLERDRMTREKFLKEVRKSWGEWRMPSN